MTNAFSKCLLSESVARIGEHASFCRTFASAARSANIAKVHACKYDDMEGGNPVTSKLATSIPSTFLHARATILPHTRTHISFSSCIHPHLSPRARITSGMPGSENRKLHSMVMALCMHCVPHRRGMKCTGPPTYNMQGPASFRSMQQRCLGARMRMHANNSTMHANTLRIISQQEGAHESAQGTGRSRRAKLLPTTVSKSSSGSISSAG